MAREVVSCLVRMGQARWGVMRPASGRGRTRLLKGQVASLTIYGAAGAMGVWKAVIGSLRHVTFGRLAVGSSILVVEGDADVRDLLFEVLTSEGGFLVRTAGTVSEARTLMAERGGGFAIAVLDVGLPDGDGRKFCASLRRQGFRLPVILLSGLGGEGDVVCGLETGAGDYLAKPFGVAELLVRVAAQLRRAAPWAVALH